MAPIKPNAELTLAQRVPLSAATFERSVWGVCALQCLQPEKGGCIHPGVKSMSWQPTSTSRWALLRARFYLPDIQKLFKWEQVSQPAMEAANTCLKSG